MMALIMSKILYEKINVKEDQFFVDLATKGMKRYELHDWSREDD
jgi:hypothetical protein